MTGGPIAWLWLAGTARAQWVTNDRTGDLDFTLAEAVAAAEPGDTLHVTGDLVEGDVTVDRNLILVGEPNASLRTNTPSGAALRVEDGVSLTVETLLVSREAVSARGVMLGAGASLTVRDSTFATGDPERSGGGIYSPDGAASIVLERVRFQGTAGRSNAVDGGALYVASPDGPVTLADVIFEWMEASNRGGAIYASETELSCTRCTFDHAEAFAGGGIYAVGGQLTLTQSLSCDAVASFGGAVSSDAGGYLRANRFIGGAGGPGSALSLDAAGWIVENNAFLGNQGSSVILARAGYFTLRNNLLYDNESPLDVDFVDDPAYIGLFSNWFGGPDRISGAEPSGTNTLGGDPVLSRWTDDGDCGDDELWPSPVVSPLIDRGSAGIFDPDGSRADIGAYGGPDADPTPHQDGDGDGWSWLRDCDDADPDVSPDAEEACNGLDDDCNGEVDEIAACTPVTTPTDVDGDGFASPEDCDDNDPRVYPGAAEDIWPQDRDCDGIGDPTTRFVPACSCATRSPSGGLLLPALIALVQRRRRRG